MKKVTKKNVESVICCIAKKRGVAKEDILLELFNSRMMLDKIRELSEYFEDDYGVEAYSILNSQK